MKHSYAELALTFLPYEDDGRTQGPALDDQGYRALLRMPPDQTLVDVEFVDGPDGNAPLGVSVHCTVRLLEPLVSVDALHVDSAVELVEASRVVARGRVLRR